MDRWPHVNLERWQKTGLTSRHYLGKKTWRVATVKYRSSIRDSMISCRFHPRRQVREHGPRGMVSHGHHQQIAPLGHLENLWKSPSPKWSFACHLIRCLDMDLHHFVGCFRVQSQHLRRRWSTTPETGGTSHLSWDVMRFRFHRIAVIAFFGLPAAEA